MVWLYDVDVSIEEVGMQWIWPAGVSVLCASVAYADACHRVAAETWLQEAIELNRTQADFHSLGKCLMNLGDLYRGNQKI